MSAPGGTDRGEFVRVLDEKWLVRELSHKGALVVCVPADRQTPGTPNAELRMQRIPSHLQDLVTERVRVLAAAPAAVRLALELGPLLEEAGKARAVNGQIFAVLDADRVRQLEELLSQVKASLEGRS